VGVRRPAACLLPAAAALALAACGSSSGPALFSPDASLGGTTLNGSQLNTADLSGHVVVVVFWGSYSAPCRADQARLNAVYAHWAPKGVRFVGVDMLDDQNAARAYAQQLHVPYESVVDKHASVAAGFLISAAPALVFIDKRGRVTDRVYGGLDVMGDPELDQQLVHLTSAT